MDSVKQQYITGIRSNTAYPTYRGIIGLITIVGYVFVGFYGLATLIGAITTMGNSFMAGLGVLIMGAIMTCLAFLFVRFFKEGALIIADIGDSVTDTNAKAQAPQ